MKKSKKTATPRPEAIDSFPETEHATRAPGPANNRLAVFTEEECEAIFHVESRLNALRGLMDLLLDSEDADTEESTPAIELFRDALQGAIVELEGALEEVEVRIIAAKKAIEVSTQPDLILKSRKGGAK